MPFGDESVPVSQTLLADITKKAIDQALASSVASFSQLIDEKLESFSEQNSSHVEEAVN
jgi:hypothetical protein